MKKEIPRTESIRLVRGVYGIFRWTYVRLLLIT